MLVVGVLLLLVAYAMLVPGLTQPMLTLSGTVEKAQLVDIGRDILRESENTSALVRGLAERFLGGLDVSGSIPAFDKRNSILGTASELWNGGNAFVAVLIVTFSVIVPTLKALLLLASAAPLAAGPRRTLGSIAAASGKWSMADVFVIAIFIAFLAGAGLSESRGLVDFQARLESGFWWFLGYCLLSLLATQLIDTGRARVRTPAPPPPSRPSAPKRLPAPKKATARKAPATRRMVKKSAARARLSSRGAR